MPIDHHHPRLVSRRTSRSTRRSTPAARRPRRAQAELGSRLGSLFCIAVALACGFLFVTDLLRGSPSAAPAAPTSTAALQSTTPYQPYIAIEDVRLGRRLAGRNPIREQVEAGLEEPNPATWREIHLEMSKDDGHRLYIELLRSLDWIELVEAEVGQTIYLDLAELGADGEAKVLEILPCPEIKRGTGTIVTGRFIHEVDSAEVLDLYIEGQANPTGVTANHPYWSVDREDFIPAGELFEGEQVDTLFGLRRVAAIRAYGGPPITKVYNVETMEHVFRVGELGTLVHNACGQYVHRWFTGSERAAKYQSRITGRLPDIVYEVRGVAFDGIDEARGVLLEAKSTGYQKNLLEPWFRGRDGLIKQARNQSKAANGTPIEWHFAEKGAADVFRKFLVDNNITGILVIFTP